MEEFSRKYISKYIMKENIVVQNVQAVLIPVVPIYWKLYFAGLTFQCLIYAYIWLRVSLKNYFQIGFLALFQRLNRHVTSACNMVVQDVLVSIISEQDPSWDWNHIMQDTAHMYNSAEFKM